MRQRCGEGAEVGLSKRLGWEQVRSVYGWVVAAYRIRQRNEEWGGGWCTVPFGCGAGTGFPFLLLCVPAFVCGASEYRRQGLDGAQFGLGWLHEHGEGMAKDLAAALRWYRSAAEQGHPLACDKVGHFYDRGLVVAADRAEAIRWFKRAFLGGLQEAGNELARLSAMSDDDTKQLAPAPAAPAARPQDPSEAAQSQALYAHRSSGSSVQSTMQLRAKSKERDHD